MKRCEREWEPARAAAVQAMVREMCGRCLCETGERCPLFAYKEDRAGTATASPSGESVRIRTMT
jgi:hypothetical protein